jgi:sigma-B regulation protein RsbU (phosphoserine phosphatase)
VSRRTDPTFGRAGDLRKVLEITRAMAATEDLDALLGLIIERSMELLRAERATVFLYDAERDELVSRVAAGEGEIRSPADRGVAGATIRQGATLLVADAYADPRFNPDVDRHTGFHTRNILSVPLRDFQGDLVGVLQVLNKAGGAFDAEDVELGEVLAAQAGVALQRARLIEHFLEKQEMERAMRIAREIQEALLPEPGPRICGYDVAGFCQPADQTGGDTYDFMALPDGRWMLVVADATGHGIGPALVIAETRAMLRALSRHGQPNATAVLRSVNELLAIDLGDARFVTCFFGLLDPLVHGLSFASAGHGPLLFYRRKEDAFEEVNATGMPLGIFAEAPFEEVLTRRLARGDFVVVTTDGFYEAVSPTGEPFGVARMLELLRRDRDLPSERMIANLHRAVRDFSAGRPPQDDLTAVILRRK